MANASRVVITPECRGSFVHMLKARESKDQQGKPTGKFAYTSDLLFPDEALDKFLIADENGSGLKEVKLSDLLVELAKEQWPNAKNPETGQPMSVKEMFSGVAMKGWPIKRGDKRADDSQAKGKDGEHYRGLRFLSVKSNVSDKVQPPILSQAIKGGKPRVFNRAMEADMEVARSLFQGGNYFVAELNIVATEVGGMKYLTPYVNAMRYIREGAKFGNRGGDLMDRFAGVQGGEADYDPTEGMDDEIPF